MLKERWSKASEEDPKSLAFQQVTLQKKCKKIVTFFKKVIITNFKPYFPLRNVLQFVFKNHRSHVFLYVIFVFFSANFSEDVVQDMPAEISTGIYFGFAKVDNGEVHKMVMSVGWNPFYHNEKKSMVSMLLNGLS